MCLWINVGSVTKTIGVVSPLGWHVAESTGGVSPVAWVSENPQDVNEFGYPTELTILIDEALGDYEILWAAAGHPHAVFPTTFLELQRLSGAQSIKVGE